MLSTTCTGVRLNSLMTVDHLLKTMVEKNASDLHLIAGLRPGFRIHGEMVPFEQA